MDETNCIFLDLLDNELTNQKIDDYISEIKNSDKVIFYFHGGLSSENYVREKLGHYLLETIFHPDNVGENTKIIFVLYKAGPFEFNKLKRFTLKILKSEGFKKLIGFLGEKIPQQLENSKNKASNKNLLLNSREEEAFLKEDVEKYFKENLKKDYINYAPRLSTAKRLDINSNKSLNHKKYKIFAFLLSFAGIYGVIGKIVVRFIRKTNHEIFPTVVEEIISKIPFVKYLKTFAQNHWSKINKNCKKIWNCNKGSYFIKKLNEIYHNENPHEIPKIEMVSHSAGSIAISHFINCIAQTNIKINNILMIVPAIKFKLYQSNIFKNQHLYNNLTIYNLGQQDEEKDNFIPFIGLEYLYTSSLLYFVSGIAEKGDKYNDNTILGLHRYFKNHKTYNTYTSDNDKHFGNVVNIRKSFIEDNNTNLVFVSKNNTVENNFGLRVIKTEGATHSNTKLPHKSFELAKDILSLLRGVPSNQISIDNSNWANVYNTYFNS